MSGDPFYRSSFWRRLRQQALARDKGICTTPGCLSVACVVDHIVPRSQGGGDTLNNLRSLCRDCDNQVKERGGKRNRGGHIKARGVSVAGWPHHRNR